MMQKSGKKRRKSHNGVANEPNSRNQIQKRQTESQTMGKNAYNPLEIKDGYIPRFFAWCKRKIKAIVTIGSIGLVLTALQAYKAWFAPDTAAEINKVIITMAQEYDALKPVVVPDSMMGNKEIQLLKEYQDEFERYKFYLNSLDYSKKSKIKAEDDEDEFISFLDKSRSMLYRYNDIDNYHEEVARMLDIISKIYAYEDESNLFNTACIRNNLILAKKSIVEWKSEREDIKAKLKYYTDKGGNFLAKREQNKLFKILERGYAGEKLLEMINTTDKLFKSFYPATNIRLREILRDGN